MALHSATGIGGIAALLHRAGLELRENGGEEAFALSGNTYANRELLKRHGGRWSRSRQAWVFPALESIRALAAALPANGQVPAGGLADAPAAYAPSAGSGSRRLPRRREPLDPA
jgi:hypothetical protein